MKLRTGLLALASLTILPFLSAHNASADDAEFQLEPIAATFAAGSEAMFRVVAFGSGADAYSLDYRAEGGSITGALALNETSSLEAAGAVFVRRESPGPVTVVASLAGKDVATASTMFVQGAPLTVRLNLVAGAEAAARTWFFSVFDASGAERAFLQASASGDEPASAVASPPLPYGEYTVRPTLGRDAAGDCTGSAFYRITPADGVAVAVGDSGANASFSVELCATASAPQSIPSGTIDDVAGDRSGGDPLPPATGNGQRVRPKLGEENRDRLGRLIVGIAGAMVLGVFATRLLASVAPVRTPKKK